MNSLLHNAEDIPLSDNDIRSILNGRCNILSYDELERYTSLDDALGAHRVLILLYQFSGTTIGHWVGCWEHRGKIYHYDSLGLRPDAESGRSHYTALIAGSQMPVSINTHQHQLVRHHTNTCGRHVALRILFGGSSHDQYHKLITGAIDIRHPDDLVTAFTLSHTLKYQ